MKDDVVDVDGADDELVAAVVDERLEDESPGVPALDPHALSTPNGARVRHVNFDRVQISILRPIEFNFNLN